MGIYSKVKKGLGAVGKVAMAPTSAMVGQAAGLAGLATGSTDRAKEWAAKAAAVPSKLGEKAAQYAGTGGLVAGEDVAKRIAAMGAAEGAAQPQAAVPAQTAAVQPTAETPISIPRPEAITSIAGAALPEEMKKALAMREAGLQGFSAPELAAQRSQMALAQGAGEQARQRQLAAAMAKAGVRGGAAAAMAGRTAQQAAQERGAQAQELFLKNIGAKQQALSDYEKAVGGGYGAAQQQQFMGLAADITAQQLQAQREIERRKAEAIEKYGASVAPTQSQPGFMSNFIKGLS